MIAFTQLCSRSALRFLQNVTVWPDFLNRRRDSNTDDDGFLRTDKMREKQKWRREFYSAMRCGGLLRRSCRSYCTLTAIGSTLALKLTDPAPRSPPSPSIRRSCTRTGNGGRTTCRCPKRARGRRFPPPWSVEVLEACFVVKDSSKPAVWAKAAIRPHFQMKLAIQLYQGRAASLGSPQYREDVSCEFERLPPSRPMASWFFCSRDARVPRRLPGCQVG